MPSDLLRQLSAFKEKHKIVAPPKKGVTSFLYDARDAAKIDSGDLVAAGLEALEGLARIDPEFEENEDLAGLFPEQKPKKRSFLLDEEDQSLKKKLKLMLQRLAPHFLSPVAQEAIEVLIRFYEINVHEAEDLVLMALPFHDTPFFSRLVKTIQIPTRSPFLFLDKCKKEGVPLKRQTLVSNCKASRETFSAVSKYFETLVKNKIPCKPWITLMNLLIMDLMADLKTIRFDIGVFLTPLIGLSFGSTRCPQEGAGVLPRHLLQDLYSLGLTVLVLLALSCEVDHAAMDTFLKRAIKRCPGPERICDLLRTLSIISSKNLSEIPDFCLNPNVISNLSKLSSENIGKSLIKIFEEHSTLGRGLLCSGLLKGLEETSLIKMWKVIKEDFETKDSLERSEVAHYFVKGLLQGFGCSPSPLSPSIVSILQEAAEVSPFSLGRSAVELGIYDKINALVGGEEDLPFTEKSRFDLEKAEHGPQKTIFEELEEEEATHEKVEEILTLLENSKRSEIRDSLLQKVAEWLQQPENYDISFHSRLAALTFASRSTPDDLLLDILMISKDNLEQILLFLALECLSVGAFTLLLALPTLTQEAYFAALLHIFDPKSVQRTRKLAVEVLRKFKKELVSGSPLPSLFLAASVPGLEDLKGASSKVVNFLEMRGGDILIDSRAVLSDLTAAFSEDTKLSAVLIKVFANSIDAFSKKKYKLIAEDVLRKFSLRGVVKALTTQKVEGRGLEILCEIFSGSADEETAKKFLNAHPLNGSTPDPILATLGTLIRFFSLEDQKKVVEGALLSFRNDHKSAVVPLAVLKNPGLDGEVMKEKVLPVVCKSKKGVKREVCSVLVGEALYSWAVVNSESCPHDAALSSLMVSNLATCLVELEGGEEARLAVLLSLVHIFLPTADKKAQKAAEKAVIKVSPLPGVTPFGLRVACSLRSIAALDACIQNSAFALDESSLSVLKFNLSKFGEAEDRSPLKCRQALQSVVRGMEKHDAQLLHLYAEQVKETSFSLLLALSVWRGEEFETLNASLLKTFSDIKCGQATTHVLESLDVFLAHTIGQTQNFSEFLTPEFPTFTKPKRFVKTVLKFVEASCIPFMDFKDGGSCLAVLKRIKDHLVALKTEGEAARTAQRISDELMVHLPPASLLEALGESLSKMDPSQVGAFSAATCRILDKKIEEGVLGWTQIAVTVQKNVVGELMKKKDCLGSWKILTKLAKLLPAGGPLQSGIMPEVKGELQKEGDERVLQEIFKFVNVLTARLKSNALGYLNWMCEDALRILGSEKTSISLKMASSEFLKISSANCGRMLSKHLEKALALSTRGKWELVVGGEGEGLELVSQNLQDACGALLVEAPLTLALEKIKNELFSADLQKLEESHSIFVQQKLVSLLTHTVLKCKNSNHLSKMDGPLSALLLRLAGETLPKSGKGFSLEFQTAKWSDSRFGWGGSDLLVGIVRCLCCVGLAVPLAQLPSFMKRLLEWKGKVKGEKEQLIADRIFLEVIGGVCKEGGEFSAATLLPVVSSELAEKLNEVQGIVAASKLKKRKSEDTPSSPDERASFASSLLKAVLSIFSLCGESGQLLDDIMKGVAQLFFCLYREVVDANLLSLHKQCAVALGERVAEGGKDEQVKNLVSTFINVAIDKKCRGESKKACIELNHALWKEVGGPLLVAQTEVLYPLAQLIESGDEEVEKEVRKMIMTLEELTGENFQELIEGRKE